MVDGGQTVKILRKPFVSLRRNRAWNYEKRIRNYSEAKPALISN